MARSNVVFLFSGQGSQYYQMGLPLYEGVPHFREKLESLDEIPKALIGTSIVELLYRSTHTKGLEFSRTLHTHPALFMVQYSLAQTLIETGNAPDCLLGTSLGEYTALAVAEVVPPQDMLQFLIRSAQALEAHCRPGKMLAVLANEELYRRNSTLRDTTTFVSASTEQQFVVSGDSAAIDRAYRELSREGIDALLLPVSHGFHSPAIDAVEEHLRQESKKLMFSPAKLPVYSGSFGALKSQYTPSDLWAIGRGAIHFRPALARVFESTTSTSIAVDLGPSGTLKREIDENDFGNTRNKVYAILSPFKTDLSEYHTVLQTLRWNTVQDQLMDTPMSPQPPHDTTQLTKRPRLAAASPRLGGNGVVGAPAKLMYLFPGQGSQRTGMGAELFEQFPELSSRADSILGYSVKEICLSNPNNCLSQTEYTQPTLFVVNAMSFLQRKRQLNERIDYLAGHSLGEYNALFAAGAFDFETGLQLVQKRAELMSKASAGGMAAIVGLTKEQVEEILRSSPIQEVEIANHNAPTQIVISGAAAQVRTAQHYFEESSKDCRFIPLPVSGAFHSKLMHQAAEAFEEFLSQFSFFDPRLPVIANVTARPYEAGKVRETLFRQITSPVSWVDSIHYALEQGVSQFEEVGVGQVLSGLTTKIRSAWTPQPKQEPAQSTLSSATNGVETKTATLPANGESSTLEASRLGSEEFRIDHNAKFSYVAGAMVHGIASSDLVIRMAQAGILSYFGSGGLSVEAVERAIRAIQAAIPDAAPYGVNLLNGPREKENIDLFLNYGVRRIEASAYFNVTENLVRYRLSGVREERDGTIHCENLILAKLSRPEVADSFLAPPPTELVETLLAKNQISAAQAQLAQNISMVDDICVESDSGGHTDMGVMTTLLPVVLKQRDQAMEQYRYPKRIRVGAAGGIGTPEAAAAAFMLGADFILTGSINQCSVEAGTSDLVKDLLQEMNVQDTEYAPAGDMFELGSRVQVLRRGLFFPARANKLFDLYRSSDSLDSIEKRTAIQIQDKFFRRSFEDVFADCIAHHSPAQIERAKSNPKHKMALIFRWYFHYTNRLALDGVADRKVDFQIHCGPALGSYNQWVAGTELESWRKRHCDEIATSIMNSCAELLQNRISSLLSANTRPASKRLGQS